MKNLMFAIIEYEHAYDILPFSSLIFEVLMFQKNILDEHEILKVPTGHLQIFHKLFEDKHAPDIQEKESVPNDVPEQVATSADAIFFIRIDTDLKENTC